MLSGQINLRTITRNIINIKKKLKPTTKFCAVVKTDAYGFGLTQISNTIEPLVDCFAVATLAEGVTLRQAGVQKDILVFGVTDDVECAIKHNLIITIGSLTAAKDLVKNHWQPRIHLGINTGMNRFGISSIHELRAVLQILSPANIEGCYTHLAYESDHPEQIKPALVLFQKFVYVVKKYYPNVLVHAGCSGVINYPAAHYDMIRVGKAMYGGTDDTQTAITLQSKIVATQKIKAGATVGYNGEFTAPAPMVVGVVQGGYAQGIQMNFTGTNFVTVAKQRCPIIGRICMDHFFIDVSHINQPLGKTVVIISTAPHQTLMAIAQQTNTIPCRILLGLKH